MEKKLIAGCLMFLLLISYIPVDASSASGDNINDQEGTDTRTYDQNLQQDGNGVEGENNVLDPNQVGDPVAGELNENSTEEIKDNIGLTEEPVATGNEIADEQTETPVENHLKVLIDNGSNLEFSNTILAPRDIPGQWIQSSNGRWWYRHNDGGYPFNMWESIGGNWYYFDASGWLQDGLIIMGNGIIVATMV